MGGSMDRRRFIQLAAATGAAALPLPGFIRSGLAADRVDIGAVYSSTGPFASAAVLANRGSRLAVETYGKAGGAPLNYILLDDQGDPGKAVRKVQEAIEQMKIRHFIGATISSMALAVSKEVHKAGGVYTNQGGADEITGPDCNRATFRWPVATYGAIEQTVRPMIELNPGAKRWYTITGQYVFGEALLRNCKAVLDEKGLEHVGNSYHSLAEKEFSGYITAAIAKRPDVLCILNFGNQTADVIRQAVSFGAKRNMKIVVPWSTGLDQFQALGSNVIEGVYFGLQYWHEVDTPGNRRLRQLVKEKLNETPTYLVAVGYAIVQMLLEGMNKANDTDPARIIAAMEGMTYEGITGDETIRAGDHQVIKDYYLAVGKARSAMKDGENFADIISSGKSFLPLDKTGCKMA